MLTSTLLVKQFVDENFENQKMAAPFLDMFIKQSRFVDAARKGHPSSTVSFLLLVF